jgi:hypothetical protein
VAAMATPLNSEIRALPYLAQYLPAGRRAVMTPKETKNREDPNTPLDTWRRFLKSGIRETNDPIAIPFILKESESDTQARETSLSIWEIN